MVRELKVSPTLVLVGVLAVVAGSAAGFLGVSAPGSGGSGGASTPSFGLSVPFWFILAAAVVLLGAAIAISIHRSGGLGVSPKSGLATIVVIALVLVGVVWLLNLPPGSPVSPVDHLLGSGGSGVGGNGHQGGGGSGTTNSTGGSGNGSGSTGGGGTGTGGGGSGNSSNHSGSGGKNGSSGNHTSGGGSGHGNGTNGTGSGKSGGGSGKNGTSLVPYPAKPPVESWPLFLGVAAAILLGIFLVPRLLSHWAIARARAAQAATPSGVRLQAARVLSQAAAELPKSTDPRSVIIQLYHQLLQRLEPRFLIPSHRTPEEIRSAHLVPLGVHPEAAGVLTRTFEEACYSSHPIGPEAIERARRSILIAEHDLRAGRAIG